MYLKEFEIRWSDLDANRHLANTAYINFMSHTRMYYLQELGFDHQTLVKNHLGPVVFYEHVYYFKEILPGDPIRVSFEIKGLSEDGMFFEFHHNFYNSSGVNLAHCEMMGAWIDLRSRKLTSLPEHLMSSFEAAHKESDFKVLTKADTRKYARAPIDLD
jgi:acyl-CoA thioester hydrolase